MTPCAAVVVIGLLLGTIQNVSHDFDIIVKPDQGTGGSGLFSGLSTLSHCGWYGESWLLELEDTQVGAWLCTEVLGSEGVLHSRSSESILQCRQSMVEGVSLGVSLGLVVATQRGLDLSSSVGQGIKSCIAILW